MARYEIMGPDGGKYAIEAPDDASPDDVMAYVQKNVAAQPSQKQPDVSMLESLGRGALQGATFGFSDEMYGAGHGLYDKLFGSGDFGGTYARERDAVREANTRAQEQNPGSYFAGEIGGSIALPLGAAKLGVKGAQIAKDASLLARTGQAAKTGAAMGGLYGLGVGEGDVENQALSTLGGAAGGAVFGSVIPGAIDAGGALLRTPLQAYRMVRDPGTVAAQKYAEAIARDAGKDAATLYQSPVKNLAASLDNAAANGDNAAMLADFAGENTKGLIRAAADMPNTRAERFNQVLNRRQQVQAGNLENSVNKNLARGEDYYGDIEKLIAQRDKKAEPMFQAAFAKETPMTPQLSRVLQRPTMIELRQSVERRLADEDQPIGLMTRTEAVHRIKMELDEQIGMSKRMERMGNRPTQGWDTRTLMILKNDLLNAIDNAPYKHALKEYAGSSALKTAAEDGLDEAFKLPPEQIAAKLRNLSSSEKDAWRQGAARSLIDKIRTGNYFRDRTKSIFDTPDMQVRLKQIFPDNASRGEFLRTVAAERRKTLTRANVQGNSKTARYLTQAQEAGKAASTVGEMAGAMMGKPGAIMKTLERGYNWASGINPDVAAKILDLAMTKSGASVRGSNSRAIQKMYAQAQARRLLQSRLSQGLLPAPSVLSAEASQGRQ